MRDAEREVPGVGTGEHALQMDRWGWDMRHFYFLVFLVFPGMETRHGGGTSAILYFGG